MKFDPRAVFEFGLYNDSDAKIQVHKRTVKEGEELVEYTVPKISGEKGPLHCILEQWPDFDSLCLAKSFNKIQKFQEYGKCLTGTYLKIWNTVVAKYYSTDEEKKESGSFNNARKKMITLTVHVEQPRDSHLDYLNDIKFEDFSSDFKPIDFYAEFERHILGTEHLEGTSPMPTDAQWNKIFVKTFPLDHQRYWLDQRKEYNDPSVTLLTIVRTMQVFYNRLKEDNLKSNGDASSNADDDDSKSKSEAKAEGEKKRKIDDIDEYCSSTTFSKPKATSICRIHGGHKWGDCNLNPLSSNYFPRDPNFQGSRGRGRGRGGGYSGGHHNGPGQIEQHHYQWSGPGTGPTSYQYQPTGPSGQPVSASSQGSTMERVYGQPPAQHPPRRHFWP
ncbi:hypothetical protein THAOC_28417 [Thalassiosira oceanica]|uniref:Uncharacterized protein n=1 Tax=Thalassiosira oceanica TaxID=159749 RepID=K0RTW0_THAOC|nr:hypothetical protein THAOC_28417 [Thalassiosira oceanica]|eukprot:EJK52321.1 hypothetical protein THAOC_28417 [Thalassiosira oceanica]